MAEIASDHIFLRQRMLSGCRVSLPRLHIVFRCVSALRLCCLSVCGHARHGFFAGRAPCWPLPRCGLLRTAHCSHLSRLPAGYRCYLAGCCCGCTPFRLPPEVGVTPRYGRRVCTSPAGPCGFYRYQAPTPAQGYRRFAPCQASARKRHQQFTDRTGPSPQHGPD